MTPQQRAILHLLQGERVVRHDEIESVLTHTAALKRDPIKSIRVQIHKLRDQGFKIRNVFGVGYQMEQDHEPRRPPP